VSQLKTLHFYEGETRKVSTQWAAQCQERNVTIVSSTWAFTDEGTVTGASLTGTLATAQLKPTCGGRLVNTVVLSNGETLIGWRLVQVESNYRY
jgi:hypothetical protein